jgi:hypothetical protein
MIKLSLGDEVIEMREINFTNKIDKLNIPLGESQ